MINTLKKKKVCKVAPIPGETKVWQYITLMRSIYLIDCPGVYQWGHGWGRGRPAEAWRVLALVLLGWREREGERVRERPAGSVGLMRRELPSPPPLLAGTVQPSGSSNTPTPPLPPPSLPIGTVQPSGNSEEDAVLKGVIRIEQLRHAEDYVAEVRPDTVNYPGIS